MRSWLALGLLIVCPLSARGSDESDVLRARGALLAAEGKCSEAIPLFQRALAADPKEARAGLLLGRCQNAAKQYAEAAKTLTDALHRDPNLQEADLELAVADYHQEDFAGARAALEKARPGLTGDARFQLYDGLVLLREGKRSEGIAALQRARRIDPKGVEPTASYVEGLALENQGERGEAKDAMERVIATDPNGRWGTAARTRLDQWAFSRGRNYWAEVTVGYESDSNVVLRGQGVDLPSDISDAADWRTVWNVNAGYEFLNTPDWGAGAALNYTGTQQHVLTDFSYDYLVGSAWVDRRLTEKLSAHMQGDYGYGWTDGGNSWVSEVAATPALDYLWAPNTYTRLFGRFYWSNYYFDPDSQAAWNQENSPPFLPDAGEARRLQSETAVYRNRDGHGEQAGLEQGLPIPALDTQLTGSAVYLRYRAGRRVLVPRRGRVGDERDPAPVEAHAAHARRVHLPRLPERHELRVRSAVRPAAQQRQPPRPDHRHRDLARAPGVLGLAARLGPLALHARGLDRERLRLRPHHLRRVLHRARSVSS